MNLRAATLVLLLFVLYGCGGGGGSIGPVPAPAQGTLVAMTVTPADPSLASGATLQLTATGNNRDGTNTDMTSSARWRSSAPGIATVNATGLVRAVAAGTATITATMGGVSGSTKITVTAAPATFPAIKLTPFVSGFSQPLYLAHAGDGSGRIFVVEKGGLVKIVRNGTILSTPFLDLTGVVRSSGSEQGLLGLAFSPSFGTSGRFYVYYTNQTGVGDVVVARHRVTSDPNVADPGGATVITVTEPFPNHNGGQLAFGPDGFLYVGVGDGGSGGNGQDLSVDLGKILRLDVESASPFAIPPGNPFHDEIWSYGLRNPWRFSFDRGTGDLYIADVGQDSFEEVDFQPAGDKGGENYGWRIMEGLHCFNATTCDETGLTMPVVEYSHDGGNCSVIGGYVYRGSQYPSLRGVYLYGDLCSGKVWGLRKSGTGWESRELADVTFPISSFGEDEAGNVYVVGFTGTVYKIDVQ